MRMWMSHFKGWNRHHSEYYPRPTGNVTQRTQHILGLSSSCGYWFKPSFQTWFLLILFPVNQRQATLFNFVYIAFPITDFTRIIYYVVEYSCHFIFRSDILCINYYFLVPQPHYFASHYTGCVLFVLRHSVTGNIIASSIIFIVHKYMEGAFY